jgi:SAM-dependent methyltransferase
MAYGTLAHTDDVERAADYAVQVADGYLALLRARGLSLPGLRVLELGPGGDFGPALLLASHGARVSVADRYLAEWRADWHPRLYRLLRERAAGAHPTGALDAVLADGRCEGVLALHRRGIERLPARGGIEPGSQDLVLSNAVLEHVHDIGRAARALAEVTAPGGTGLHQVDFRDHRDSSRPLEYLTLDPLRFAALMRWSRGGCGNRRRRVEFAAAFEAAGFGIEHFEPNLHADEAYLEDVLGRCRPRYRRFPRAELSLLSGRFTLVKR